MPPPVSELDVPLLPCELSTEPSVVCVTGVTGYIASAVCARLLASGHTVHGTVRDLRKQDLMKELKELPGASERLKFFEASLTVEGSFDAAVTGCDYVLHLASPFTLAIPKGKTAREVMLDPAVKGVDNVFASVNKTPTVKRVVLTSSAAAVYGDPEEHGKGYVYTEKDWNTTSREDVDPYPLSKTMAERRAHELHAQQTRWELVTILPAAVFGPQIGSRADGEIVKIMIDMCKGKMWPGCPALGFGTVDLRDIAAAHCVSMTHESASGRYLVTNKSMDVLDIARVVGQLYPGKYWLPWGHAPLWLVSLIAPLIGIDPQQLKVGWNKIPLFDTSRAQNELGIKYLPMERSVKDMVDRLIALKHLK